MEEEDAFWCLTVIIYRVIPGYFSDGMARIFLDGRVLGALLHLHLPAVGLQLQELSAATTGDDAFALRIITQQWLQTLFVNVMPEECTLAVWRAAPPSTQRRGGRTRLTRARRPCARAGTCCCPAGTVPRCSARRWRCWSRRRSASRWRWRWASQWS